MIGNYSGYSVKMNASSNPEISLIGAISNVEGLWMSWLPAIKNSPVVLKGFGSILSLAGIYDSGQDAVRTLIAVYNGDIENYSTQDVLDMVSTALNTLGFLACCVPEPMMTKVVGATLSFSGCVVGLIAPMFNYNDLKNTIVRLPLGGGYVTLYIV